MQNQILENLVQSNNYSLYINHIHSTTKAIKCTTSDQEKERSLHEVVVPWELCSQIIEASVEAPQQLNMLLVVVYSHYSRKTPFLEIVDSSVSSFEPRNIGLLLLQKPNSPIFSICECFLFEVVNSGRPLIPVTMNRGGLLSNLRPCTR